MIAVAQNILGAALALLIGAAIAWGNYRFSRYVLRKKPAAFVSASVARQLLQVGYLLLLFFLGPYTPFDRLWLLIGGCLGITLPMLWLTPRLVKWNDSLNDSHAQSGKEDPRDG